MSKHRAFNVFVAALLGLGYAPHKHTDELGDMAAGKHEGTVEKGESLKSATSLMRFPGPEEDEKSAKTAWDSSSNPSDIKSNDHLSESHQKALESAEKSYQQYVSATSALNKRKALLAMDFSLGGSEDIRKQFETNSGFSRKDYFKALSENAPHAIKELNGEIDFLPQGDFLTRWTKTTQLKDILEDIGINENGIIDHPEIAELRRKELTGLSTIDVETQLSQLARPAAEQAYPVVVDASTRRPQSEAVWDAYWRSFTALNSYIGMGNQPGGNENQLSNLGMTIEQWELLLVNLPVTDKGVREYAPKTIKSWNNPRPAQQELSPS